MIVRQALTQDLPNLVFLHRCLYLDHRRAISPTGLDRFFEYEDFQHVLKQDMEAMLRASETRVLVAENESKEICGYITGSLKSSIGQVIRKRGVVGDWYVDEAQRGTGIGAKLLKTLIDWFEEQQCSAVESATWAFNRSGRGAHEALGFREAKVHYFLDLRKEREH